jgi:hypothetical protein
MSAIVGEPIKINDGNRCYATGATTVNGTLDVYETNYGYLYYSNTYNEWRITEKFLIKDLEWSESVTAGTPPSTSTVWLGDVWWSSPTRLGTYSPRGYHKTVTAERPSLTVSSAQVVGWKSENAIFNSMYCKYTPVVDSGLTGNKYAGWLTYRDSVKSQTFVDNGATLNDKPIFVNGTGRYLWKDTSAWIISAAVGAKTATAGYWTGSSLPGTFTRIWEATNPNATPPEVDPEPTEYSLAFLEYGSTAKPVDQLLAQVAIWL